MSNYPRDLPRDPDTLELRAGPVYYGRDTGPLCLDHARALDRESMQGDVIGVEQWAIPDPDAPAAPCGHCGHPTSCTDYDPDPQA